MASYLPGYARGLTTGWGEDYATDFRRRADHGPYDETNVHRKATNQDKENADRWASYDKAANAFKGSGNGGKKKKKRKSGKNHGDDTGKLQALANLMSMLGINHSNSGGGASGKMLSALAGARAKQTHRPGYVVQLLEPQRQILHDAQLTYYDNMSRFKGTSYKEYLLEKNTEQTSVDFAKKKAYEDAITNAYESVKNHPHDSSKWTPRAKQAWRQVQRLEKKIEYAEQKYSDKVIAKETNNELMSKEAFSGDNGLRGVMTTFFKAKHEALKTEDPKDRKSKEDSARAAKKDGLALWRTTYNIPPRQVQVKKSPAEKRAEKARKYEEERQADERRLNSVDKKFGW